MDNKLFSTLAAAALAMASHGAEAAPVLTFQGNVLTGATGVSVDGGLYDVQFVDGTCGAVFGTQCGNTNVASSFSNVASSFLFSTSQLATDAAQALVNQVGAVHGTSAVAGCGTNVGSACSVLTPYTTVSNTVQTKAAAFGQSNVAATVSEIDLSTNFDTRSSDSQVYALFTAETPVPEPATASTLLVGAAAATGLRMKRRKKRPGGTSA